MLTSDIALKEDPVYEEIGERFLADPDAFADAFARAWFKLTHRDMGPIQRYLGPEVPAEELIWQDRVPAVDHELVSADDVAALKAHDPGLGPVRLPPGRHRLGLGLDLPQQRQARRGQRRPPAPGAAERAGPSTSPTSSRGALRTLEGIQADFNAAGGAKISLADLIVLAGAAAVEKAAARRRPRGHRALHAGSHRRHARSRPTSSRSRPWSRAPTGSATTSARVTACPRSTCWSTGPTCSDLTAPELTVLVGGLRVLGANTGGSTHGVLTSAPGTLTNDFFVNLLGMGTQWTSVDGRRGHLRGPRRTGASAGPAPATTWSSARTPSCAPSPRSTPARTPAAKFVRDFVVAWDKVMMADRYDLG